MDPVALQSRLQAGLSDRYAVAHAVGQGGSATVFLAEDLRHQRSVALKVLHPELSAVIGAERFLREIAIVAQLQHPHILPLYDSGESDGLLYYVMPFAADGTLRHRLEREGRLTVAETIGIAREVAGGLAFAHERGVVHRDIKPENVLLFSGAIVIADFGIARSSPSAGDLRRTEAGMALGTPLYMSPEQASASGGVDGRSDQYSLACMVHEMLTGVPPFGGASPNEVMVRHLAETPLLAPTALTPTIASALARALAKRPADRYPTITAFADALRVPSGETMPVRPPVRRRVAVLTAAALVLGGAGLAVSRVAARPALDRDLFVVLPFTHAGNVAPQLLDGDACAVAVRDALSRWTDVRQVDHLRLNDLLARRGGPPANLGEALDVARRLGAGRAVWGELRGAGDSVRVHAGLYDVRTGRLLRPHGVTIAAGAGGREVGADFGRLAGALLLEPSAGPTDSLSLGTTVLAAWRAYSAGHAALRLWDLGAAADRFGEAVRLDPEYAQASAWLAHVGWWANAPPATWRPHIARAVALAGRLRTSRDSARAAALLALADSQFPDACARYRGLTARDSLDPIAWYGLGECLRSDPTVVRDARSPSRWRFRTSFHEGVAAFERALAIAPSFNRAFGTGVYARLVRVLPVEPGRFRLGFAAPPDTGLFAAFPQLEADTIGYVPHPLAEAMAGTDRPATMAAALTRNRVRLQRLVEQWVAAFPASGAAHAAYGFVLEMEGRLEGSEPAALGEFRLARRFAATPLATARAVLHELRVLVRLERFDDVVRLADSALAEPAPAPEAAAHLAAVASLRGRVHRAADLLERAAPVYVFGVTSGPVHEPVARAALRFAVYAAFGQPAESIVQGAARVEALNRRWTDRTRRDRVYANLMDASLGFAFPVLGVSEAHQRRAGDYLLQLQWWLGRGDTARARHELAGLARERGTMRPGDVALVAVLHEALLYLAVGDTAAATRGLDLGVADLSAAQTVLLDAPASAAALVRAFILRARLAAHAGDTPTAQRWARAARILWAGADPELQPLLDSLRAVVPE